MKKLADRKRRILRWMYATISLTSVAFVFQACYGTPRDLGMDVIIRGIVTSKSSRDPVAGIKVTVDSLHHYEVTDKDGRFSIYVPVDSLYNVKFEDIDTLRDRVLLPKDTVVRRIDRFIVLNISMDEE